MKAPLEVGDTRSSPKPSSRHRSAISGSRGQETICCTVNVELKSRSRHWTTRDLASHPLARFQQNKVITLLVKLVSCGQSGYATANDYCPTAHYGVGSGDATVPSL